MIDHLNLFVPEWQGYGVDDSPCKGARWLRHHLLQDVQFSEIEIDDRETLTMTDGVLGLESVCQTLASVQSCLQRHQPKSTFLLGGTCGTEVATVAYHNEQLQGDLAVLWFDAHGDLNVPSSSPSGHFHGMPLRVMLGEGAESAVRLVGRSLRPEQLFMVGARDLDAAEIEFIDQQQITVIPVNAQPSDIGDLLCSAGFNNIYLHFDLDVLEPSEFDEMIFQIDHGMTKQAALAHVRWLTQRFNIAGTSLLEFVPKSGGDNHAFLQELIALLR